MMNKVNSKSISGQDNIQCACGKTTMSLYHNELIYDDQSKQYKCEIACGSFKNCRKHV